MPVSASSSTKLSCSRTALNRWISTDIIIVVVVVVVMCLHAMWVFCAVYTCLLCAEKGEEIQAALLEITGQKTVPSVFISGQHVGRWQLTSLTLSHTHIQVDTCFHCDSCLRGLHWFWKVLIFGDWKSGPYSPKIGHWSWKSADIWFQRCWKISQASTLLAVVYLGPYEENYFGLVVLLCLHLSLLTSSLLYVVLQCPALVWNS